MLNVKEVTPSLCEAMEKQKISFMRILQHRFTVRSGKDELLESWKEIVYKLTTENLEKLGLTLDPNTRITDHPIRSFENNFPLFHFVAGFGDLELYRFLASNGNPVNKDGPEGYTPLHSAALNGQLEVCQFILDRVQEKNPAARFVSTPLHYAAKRGHEEVFKAIANEVEEKNPGNNNGETPLHAAARGYFQFILDRVEDKNPRKSCVTTPLHYAAVGGHEESLKPFS